MTILGIDRGAAMRSLAAALASRCRVGRTTTHRFSRKLDTPGGYDAIEGSFGPGATRPGKDKAERRR